MEEIQENAKKSSDYTESDVKSQQSKNSLEDD